MRPKLLLADDSVTIQRVIELTFADEDVDVRVVGDGAQAIEQIRTNTPDIVLADTSMPEKDGYDVAAFVKNDASFAHIPVVLLTGAFEPLDSARAETVGSDGVLVKPFEPQQVIGKVRELLAPRAPALADDHPAPLPPDAPVAEAPVTPPPVTVAPLPSPSDATKSRVDDGKLANYFDQLDEAFASADVPADGRPVLAGAPTRTPILDRDAAAAPTRADAGRESEAALPADLDRLDLEALVEDGARAAAQVSAPLSAEPPLASPAATPEPPPRVASELAAAGAASAAVPEVPSPEPPRSPSVAGARSDATPTPPVPASTELASSVPAPSASAAAPPQYAASTVLAQAFATFLAVEQGAPPPRLDTAGRSETSDGPIPESMVDDVVQRVVARMTDAIVRDTTAEIVSEVAERLVRDEIDRIKAGAK